MKTVKCLWCGQVLPLTRKGRPKQHRNGAKTPVAWAHFDINRLELRTSPLPGWRPLTWADKLPPPTYDRATVEKLAASYGWTPPPDRAQLVREFLEFQHYGVKADVLRTLTGVKQILRVLGPMRASGEVKCWPVKGRGSVWFLAKYEGNVQKAWTDRQNQRRLAENAAALQRYYLKKGQT